MRQVHHFTLLLGVMACGITDRHVEERGGFGGQGFGGQGSGGALAPSGQAAFPSGGYGTGGGFPGAGMPAGGAFNPGAGGKASGGMPPMACFLVPEVVPSCVVEAAAGQGGAGGEASPWCALQAEPDVGSGGAGDAGAAGVAGDSGAAETAGAPGVLPDPHRLLIDDFEDGDTASFAVLSGRGSWFAVNDGSGQQFPMPCTLPSPIPGGRGSSLQALHTYGQGFTSAPGGYSLVGVTLRSGAPACDQAIDASAFAGVEFWARGSGVVRFFVATVATNPLADGGSCPERCYDSHGESLLLTNDWTYFKIPFVKLQQEGWGYSASFLRSQILTIQWSAKVAPYDPTPASCFDFWIDDVAFYAD